MTINPPRIDKSFYQFETLSTVLDVPDEGRIDAIIAALPVLPVPPHITPFMTQARRCLEQAKAQPQLLERVLIPLLRNLFVQSTATRLLTWKEAAAIVANCRYIRQPDFWEAVTGDIYAVESALDVKVETELERRKAELTRKGASYASPIHDTADLRAILLPLEVAKAIVCADGTINRGLLPRIKKIFLSEKEQRDGVERAIAQGLDQLQQDDLLVTQIESICLPARQTHAEDIASIALVDHEEALDLWGVRVACLASCLTWIRQHELQDCFARSTLTTIAWTSLRHLVSNMQQIVTNDGLTTKMADGQDMVVAPLWILCPNATTTPCLCTDLFKLFASPFVQKACSLLDISELRFQQAAIDVSHDNLFTLLDVLLHEAPENPLFPSALAILEAPTQNTLVRMVENSLLTIRTFGRECYQRFVTCMAHILTSKGIGVAEAPQLIRQHIHLGYYPILPNGQEGLWYYSSKRTSLLQNENALIEALNEILSDQNKIATVNPNDLSTVRSESFFNEYLAGYDANVSERGEMLRLYFGTSKVDSACNTLCHITGSFLVSKSNDIAVQLGGIRPWIQIPISCGCHVYCFQPHRVVEFAGGRSPDEVSQSLMAASHTLLKTSVHKIPDFSIFFDCVLSSLVSNHYPPEQVAFVSNLKQKAGEEETVETVISKIVAHFPDGLCPEEPIISLTSELESPQDRDKSRLFAIVLGLARTAFPTLQPLLPFGDSNFKIAHGADRQTESLIYSFYDPQTGRWRTAFSLSNEILQMLDYGEIAIELSQFPSLQEGRLRRRKLELQWKTSKSVWKLSPRN